MSPQDSPTGITRESFLASSDVAEYMQKGVVDLKIIDILLEEVGVKDSTLITFEQYHKVIGFIDRIDNVLMESFSPSCNSSGSSRSLSEAFKEVRNFTSPQIQEQRKNIILEIQQILAANDLVKKPSPTKKVII